MTAPAGSRLEFAVRSDSSEADIVAAQWRPVVNGIFLVDDADRVLQYRATLHSDNGDRYPVLVRVEISLKP